MKGDINTKSILVVGANGSLAKETIKQLLRDGATKITMACRTESKGYEARAEVLSEVSVKAKVHIPVVGGFDMIDPLQIEKALVGLATDLMKFDIVFLAAGFAVFSEDYESVTWKGKKIEKNVFQNMIGSHITYLHLKRLALLSENARIIIAGGEGSRGIKGMIEKPDFKSPQELRDYIYLAKYPKYNAMNAIGVSKLCGAFWTSKVSELEAGKLEIIWFSPGLTSGSAGLNDLPPLKKWFMNTVMFGFLSLLGKAQSPRDGGRKFAACLEGELGTNGALLGAPEGESLGVITDQTPLNSLFSNVEMIDEFWKILHELEF